MLLIERKTLLGVHKSRLAVHKMLLTGFTYVQWTQVKSFRLGFESFRLALSVASRRSVLRRTARYCVIRFDTARVCLLGKRETFFSLLAARGNVLFDLTQSMCSSLTLISFSV